MTDTSSKQIKVTIYNVNNNSAKTIGFLRQLPRRCFQTFILGFFYLKYFCVTRTLTFRMLLMIIGAEIVVAKRLAAARFSTK